ncbi:hypothetical protein [Aestuariivirga sp.]|uniref:hypothetical protein n=1 Tax=Aestuariivirga sp. TaxID=2650926 RepID=UPI003BA9D504
MLRLSTVLLASVLIVPLALPAGAATKCTGNTCTTQKAKAPAKKTAAKKTPSKSAKKMPPPDARARYYESALAFCKKKYGAPSRIWRIDYTHMRVWCEPPSY